MSFTSDDPIADAAALQLRFEATLEEMASRSGSGLLRILVWDYELSSEDIARLMRAPVAAVHRWRMLGDIPPRLQEAMLHLVAFLSALEELPGPLSSREWLNREPLEGYVATPARVWTCTRSKALLQVAAGELDGEEFLDAEMPGWRVLFDARSFAARGGEGVFGIH